MNTSLPDPGALARISCAVGGGAHSYAPDRDFARELMRCWPDLRDYLAAERAFRSRLLLWSADGGARGLIVAAAGYPVRPCRLPAALEGHPDARIAYTDADPEVTAVNRAELGAGRVTAFQADAADPAGLLSAPEAGELPWPLLVYLRLMLHWQSPDAAAGIIEGYARRLPPGSLLALSVPAPSEDVAGRCSGLLEDAGAGLRLYVHDPGTVASWLDNAGLKTVEPGVTDVRTWPLSPVKTAQPAAACGRIAAAVARVP